MGCFGDYSMNIYDFPKILSKKILWYYSDIAEISQNFLISGTFGEFQPRILNQEVCFYMKSGSFCLRSPIQLNLSF